MAQWIKVTVTKPDKSKCNAQDAHGARSLTLTDLLIRQSHTLSSMYTYIYIYRINECTF